MQSMINHWIEIAGTAVDVFGVVVICFGIIWSSGIFFRKPYNDKSYGDYRLRIGRSLLLGLEILVAADIIKTVALAPAFRSLGILAGLVLIRTFLSWTLAAEVEQVKPSSGGGL